MTGARLPFTNLRERIPRRAWKIWDKVSERERLFRNSVWFSVLFHFGLFGLFYVKNLINFEPDHSMEIDLTKPFRIGGNPLLKPGGGTTLKDVKNPAPPAPMEDPHVEKPKPPQNWVIPGPETKVIEKPGPEGVPVENQSPQGIEGGAGEGYTGTRGGFGGGDGEGGGIKLDRIPILLNKREVLRLLRKNYPPAEREAGITSRVIVNLHLDIYGGVTGVEVTTSGGAHFDGVAKDVAKRMRFKPAMANAAPVAVKISQEIIFKLEDSEGE